jgi:molybdopterin molybdotransferase
MDGYAVRAADIAAAPAKLSLIGASIAGRRFEGHVGPGQAVRIFTGAPVPDGADTILIQEDAQAGDGTVTAMVSVTAGRHIRCAGFDFRAGETVLPRGRVLDPAALSLAATTGRAALDVVRRPRVAILSTGSELVPPGVAPGPDQIVASNAYGVAALVRDAGGEALDLGIVADDEARLRAAIRDARASGADVVVTLGGASVGDHDLVAAALAAEGMAPGFWKIAMRPGKPLLFGRFGAVRVLGLPGNPVSSLVCGHVFLKPLVAALAGLPAAPALRDAVLAAPMKANDHRQDYVRAVARQGESLVATPFATQDSSVLTTFAAANALIVRAPGAPAAEAGDPCAVLMLR